MTFSVLSLARPSVLTIARDLNDREAKLGFKNWDLDKALATLGYREEPFPQKLQGTALHGDSMGDYLRVDPTLEKPGYVYLHELAHLVLDHTQEKIQFVSQHGPYRSRHSEAMVARQEVEADMVSISLANELGGSMDQEDAILHLSFNTWGMGDLQPNKQRVEQAIKIIRKAGR